MRRAAAPALVPELRAAVYLVLDDLGHDFGLTYREARLAESDEATVIENLLTGQYDSPLRVVAFDVEEGWSRDTSEDVAREVMARARAEDRDLPHSTRIFIERHVGVDLRVDSQ
jgi:hypothetical protein